MIDPKEIRIEQKWNTVNDILGELKSKLLIFPENSKLTWPIEKSSKLIESILLMIPIGNVLFEYQQNGDVLIADGCQRILSIKAFCDGDFTLNGLVFQTKEGHKTIKDDYYWPCYNGLTFMGLPFYLQRRILRTVIYNNRIIMPISGDLRTELISRLK